MESKLKQELSSRTPVPKIETADNGTIVIVNEESLPMLELTASFPSGDQTIEGGSLGSEVGRENSHLKAIESNVHEQLETLCCNKEEGDISGIKDESGQTYKRNKEDGKKYQVVLISNKDLIAEEYGGSLKDIVTNVISEQLSQEDDMKNKDLENRSISDDDSHDISDRYLCHICGKVYKQLSHLSRHTKSAHHNNDVHQCNFCNTTFTRSESLIRHLKLHEQRQGTMPTKGPYKCPLCTKSYQQPYNVSRHLLTHYGKKPFHCPECDKKFTQHTGLSRHLVLHRGSKDFKCDVCGKAFARQFVLTRHKLTHTDDKPYKCFVCSKSFIRASQLDVHIKGHKRADKQGRSQPTTEEHDCG